MNLRDIPNPLAGDKCLLCGDTPSVIGIFIPDDPQKWGAAPSKKRFVRYCLCEKCKQNKKTPELVEKVILVELSGGGAVYE
ncbi:MAG: hypothetical protein WC949_04975 [Candidatus Paceibacterota bacterium]|jgi:hypothetical protein